MTLSPKGKFRMWHAAILAVVFLILSGTQSSQSSFPWLWEAVNMLGRIGLGLFALYYGGYKQFVHTRTHELPKELRDERENYLIIAAAIVIGCALIG